MHRSENSNRLVIQQLVYDSLAHQISKVANRPTIWVYSLPMRGTNTADRERIFKAATDLRLSGSQNNVLAIIANPEDAARIAMTLGCTWKFQLWVSVKVEIGIHSDSGRLKENHAAVLIFTAYPGALKHAKTRIAYTYCPACNKTTKDYGGKKHTYDPYGTLMSDVWRDLECSAESIHVAVVERLADVFGIDPYRDIIAVDFATKYRSDIISSGRSARVIDCISSPLITKELVNQDCINAMSKMPDNSVDFAFADPPYNLAKKYDGFDDAIELKNYHKWCNEWLGQMLRVLRPGRTLAVLNIPDRAIRHFQFLEKISQFQNWIVWEGLSCPVRFIMPANYPILCVTKGEPRSLPIATSMDQENRTAIMTLKEWFCIRASCIAKRGMNHISDRETIADLWWDIHRLKHNSKRVDHPCQLPPQLMNRLICAFTYLGETVLDPFNGSGTTSLCASMLGRGYVGIELSAEYHRIAVDRHSRLAMGDDPFGKTGLTAQAKNSRVRRMVKTKYAIPKKTLQLDIRRIAQELGRLPKRNEVELMSKYPISYYDEYFVSWGEVCAAARHAGMKETRNDGIDAQT